MWRDELLILAEKLVHPAWGINHFHRVYGSSLDIANAEKAPIDEESLCAASYLHDIGAHQPYRIAGIDHAERSSQVCDEILAAMGFPVEKTMLVREIVKDHMFYTSPGSSFEAVVFRDADILEFMGVIGITRILSIVGLDDWTPDLKSAINLIDEFSVELPEKLITKYAKRLGDIRKKEMRDYLTTLSVSTPLTEV